jgi:hypothetical protein
MKRTTEDFAKAVDEYLKGINTRTVGAYTEEAQMANANVGEWVEEVQVQRNVSETVKLYPGARVQYAGVEWVLLSLGFGEKLYWATPKDGYLSRASDSGGDSALYADAILSEGDATKRYFLNHTVTKTVTATETKRTPVGAGSVFASPNGGQKRIIVGLGVTAGLGWAIYDPAEGQVRQRQETLKGLLAFLEGGGWKLIEAKGGG